MTRNAIVLPAGVVLPPPPAVAPMPEGPPFDRVFFERYLSEVAAAFCERAGCDSVIVELLTTDGATHLVRGISAIHDQWVALQTVSRERRYPVDAFIPYQTIFRVELHPRLARQPRRLGFVDLEPNGLSGPALLESGESPPAEPA
jgi:hypothetical protein